MHTAHPAVLTANSAGNYVAQGRRLEALMADGLDECRRCGAAMPFAGAEAAARYELTKVQKPTMPEAEWRAKGWKAAPTVYQLNHKLDGLCRECSWQVGTRAPHRTRPLMVALLATAVLLLIVFLLR